MKDKIAVIITAGGSGVRMKSDINKVYLDVEGIPVLARTISKFYDLDYINEIIVAINPAEHELFRKKIQEPYHFDNLKIVNGGKERHDSSFNALKKISPDTDFVLIHDGSRPFVNETIIKDCIEKTKEFGAAVASVPAVDTMKYSSNQKTIDYTPPREKLFHAQTPQGFSYPLLKEALHGDKELFSSITDDASIVEKMGRTVALSKGERTNIKLTTPDDLIYAQAIAKIL